MNERLKTLLAQMKEGEYVALPAIETAPFDSTFLRTALEIAPGQSLMHYMKLDRFKSLLTNGGIYMRRLDLFELDPHEGRFPKANATQLSSLGQGLASQLGLMTNSLDGYRHFYEETLPRLTYVHCWFAWDNEDVRMWQEYGDNGKGVCIRTTARRLGGALGQLPDFGLNLCGITYCGEEQSIPEVISFLPACRKRPQFAHEREVRLIGQLGEKTWQTSYTNEGLRTPDYQLLKIDFHRLIERIYVGPNASAAVFAEVETLGNDATGCRVVHRSTVASGKI